MTILWISVIVGWAVIAIIALRALDYERRLFSTNGGLKPRHGGSGRERSAADRLRHMLSRTRDSLARMTAGRGAWEMLSATISMGEIKDWVLQRFHKEHAARVVLRAMSAAAAPALEAQLLTAYAEVPLTPAVGLPTVAKESSRLSDVEARSDQSCPEAPRRGERAIEKTPAAGRSDLRADHVAALQPVIDTLIVTASEAGEGIVRVDATGQLRFPDAIARELLSWTSGERTLSDILVGGGREATALLESVAHQEVVEQNVTVLTGGSPQQLHVTALTSRNRDGNLWGALLILRRR